MIQIIDGLRVLPWVWKSLEKMILIIFRTLKSPLDSDPDPHQRSLALDCRFPSKPLKVNPIYLNIIDANSEAG